MIEAAENVLRDLGFYDVRVRHHELGSGPRPSASTGDPGPSASDVAPVSPVLHLARIEVGPSELPKFLANGSTLKVAEALKAVGYAHVTLDLQGYRRGSTNETLQKGQTG
jgi:uncharacterized protein